MLEMSDGLSVCSCCSWSFKSLLMVQVLKSLYQLLLWLMMVETEKNATESRSKWIFGLQNTFLYWTNFLISDNKFKCLNSWLIWYLSCVWLLAEVSADIQSLCKALKLYVQRLYSMEDTRKRLEVPIWPGVSKRPNSFDVSEAARGRAMMKNRINSLDCE